MTVYKSRFEKNRLHSGLALVVLGVALRLASEELWSRGSEWGDYAYYASLSVALGGIACIGWSADVGNRIWSKREWGEKD